MFLSTWWTIGTALHLIEIVRRKSNSESQPSVVRTRHKSHVIGAEKKETRTVLPFVASRHSGC